MKPVRDRFVATAPQTVSDAALVHYRSPIAFLFLPVRSTSDNVRDRRLRRAAGYRQRSGHRTVEVVVRRVERRARLQGFVDSRDKRDG